MRKFVLIPLALLMSGGCALPSPENNAIGDARDMARQVGERLDSGSVRSAQDVGHLADDMDGVEVMRVTGTTTARRDGVGLVVRVSGIAAGGWGDPETVTVTHCFELRVSPKTRWGGDEPRDVDCPHGAPLTFKPWPKTPEIPYERLRKALPRVPRGGTVDESEVRSAVASLHLDPAIRTDVQAHDGMVGISLKVKPYLADALECALAAVAPGRTNVWSPSRIQRMPGEGGCDVGNAIHPMPPPH
jgi:hypothetical protein